MTSGGAKCLPRLNSWSEKSTPKSPLSSHEESAGMVLWSRYANRVNQMGQRMGAWTAIGTSRWVYDGWNRIALLSPSNAVTEEY